MVLPIQENVVQKTIKGIFWSSLSLIGGKGFAFLSTLILARLLLPEQFGLMGYCLIIIQYLDVVNAAGIRIALISRQEKFEEAANAGFIANLILGVFTFLLLWFITPFAAEFFNDYRITPLLRALAFTLPISALGMVPDAILQRNIKFKTRIISEIGRSSVKAIVAIVLAFLGFGVWSLVISQIASVLVGVVLSWLLTDWKPTWRFDPEVNRGMFAFSINILIMDFSGIFASNIDYILVGRILGTAALGYYTMSFRIPELFINSINTAIGTVSFPALASLQNDKQKMQGFYFGYIRYLSLIIFPTGIGLSLITPILIPFFLSDLWIPAVFPSSLIAIAFSVAALGYVPGVLYKSIGRPELLNYLSIIKIPFIIFITWYSTRWGIAGVSAGQIAIACILLTIDILFVNYLMKYKIIDLFHSIFPSLFSSLIMAIFLLLISRFYPPNGIIGSLCFLFGGVGSYFLTFLLLSKETVVEGMKILRRVFVK